MFEFVFPSLSIHIFFVFTWFTFRPLLSLSSDIFRNFSVSILILFHWCLAQRLLKSPKLSFSQCGRFDNSFQNCKILPTIRLLVLWLSQYWISYKCFLDLLFVITVLESIKLSFNSLIGTKPKYYFHSPFFTIALQNIRLSILY